ncbi:MAG: PEP-CTERM sorting domain-containing protein [Roseateles sp.]|uniref:PEP-CTERM sorting domain-containing protein n=1 Tax=Roseateles sp. TaxID=1971397 RepID=UPI004035A49F
MKTQLTLAVAAAACLAAPLAEAADALPAGTLITGQVSGASQTLLGLDHLFADKAGSNTTALAPADLEFMTSDFAVAVDFFSDGRVQVWNNSGTTGLAGSYTLSFSLAGLGAPISGFTPLDLSGVGGGTIGLQLVGPDSVSLTLNNLSFTGEFGSFTTQIAVTAVPEPTGLALLAAGLGLLALRRKAVA